MQRFREIAIAFSRNGFGFFVRELGLHHVLSLPKRLFVREQPEVHPKTRGERIRYFLEELGPTFIKIGQIASTRPDLIPEDILQELEKLQDEVPPFPYSEVQAIIEQELGGRISDIFTEFRAVPFGAASIGQVHYGVLKTGEKVAVKIQRPNIEKGIKTDLEILLQLAQTAELRIDWAARYQISEIVKEFSKTLIAELDYTVEGQNADRIAAQFKDDPTIKIPDVYWDYTTKKVLTLEYVEGIKMNEIKKLQLRKYDTKVLAERVANAIFHQILIEGFFHGDPHPGNVIALPDEVVGFIDFGMVGRLTPEMKRDFASLVIAMMRQNTDGMIKAITKMGLVPEDVNMSQLRVDVDMLRDKYYDVPFSQVSIGEAVNDLFSVAQKHRIQIPADLSLMGKSLLTMEGMVAKLDPDLSIVKIAEPFGRQLLKERYRPKKVAEGVFNQWGEYGEILIDLPRQLQELASITKKGKLPLEISVPQAAVFLRKLDRMSNRLSFSIGLLSFSIIMVGLIIGSALRDQSSILWNIPAVEIGFIVALLLFVWLIFSIFRSGRF